MDQQLIRQAIMQQYIWIKWKLETEHIMDAFFPSLPFHPFYFPFLPLPFPSPPYPSPSSPSVSLPLSLPFPLLQFRFPFPTCFSSLPVFSSEKVWMGMAILPFLQRLQVAAYVFYRVATHPGFTRTSQFLAYLSHVPGRPSSGCPCPNFLE